MTTDCMSELKKHSVSLTTAVVATFYVATERSPSIKESQMPEGTYSTHPLLSTVMAKKCSIVACQENL